MMTTDTPPQKVPDAVVREAAVHASCHPTSVRRRLRGASIRGVAGLRVEAAIRFIRARGYVCTNEGRPFGEPEA